MNSIYLVRHGQAGTREAYDSLSELGRQQARLVGEYFVSQGIEFAAAYTGEMLRQRYTAAEVKAAYASAGLAFPELMVDCGWNEFDFQRVYREISPQLWEEDSEFRRESREAEDLRRQLPASTGISDATAFQHWSPCDLMVLEAWIAGRYPCTGESWEQFLERVAACRLRMTAIQPPANIVVFTSSIPIAVWVGLALDIFDQRLIRLTDVLHNTSYTVLRLRQKQLRLLMFNLAPHLVSPELRTHR